MKLEHFANAGTTANAAANTAARSRTIALPELYSGELKITCNRVDSNAKVHYETAYLDLPLP